MIQSLVKIEFVPVTGSNILLLDYWDEITDYPKFPLSQKDVAYTAAGAKWERGRPAGGAAYSGSWTRKVYHATHQAADLYSFTHQASMPINVMGKLRVSFQGAGVIEYKDARILACVPARLTKTAPGRVPTITEYRANMGEMVVVDSTVYTPPTVTPGVPPSVLPPYTALMGVMVSGVTNPPGMNGFLDLQHPLNPSSSEWAYQGSGSVVSRIHHIGDGEFFLYGPDELWEFRAGGGDPEHGFPWEAGPWTPRDGSGATGTVVVTPVYR